MGDTRIQALISYAVTGDDRLARQAHRKPSTSRASPTASPTAAIPVRCRRSFPPFPCSMIGMVHDYWLYRPDPEPARATLPGTRTVLAWFATHEQPDGLLDKLPWWSFIDWVSNRRDSHLRRQRRVLRDHARIPGRTERCRRSRKGLGDPHLAARYQARAAHVRSGLYGKCWNASRGLHRRQSRPEELQPAGQHPGRPLRRQSPKTTSRRCCAGCWPSSPAPPPTAFSSASYYFRFYLARALDHAGMADEYLNSIDPWRKLLPLHFSTWPEIPGNTRSDSHAWSAHPIYDLLTLVAGIEPASPRLRHGPHRSPPGHAALAQGQLSPSRGHDRGGISPPGRRTRRNHHSARQAHRQLRL